MVDRLNSGGYASVQERIPGNAAAMLHKHSLNLKEFDEAVDRYVQNR